MAERAKYNLKQELLKLNDYVLGKVDGVDRRKSLLGIDALTKPDYNNSMRTNMFTSQSRQFVTLTNPHFPKVFFGAEKTVGDNSDGYKQIRDGEKKVFKKVAKYDELIAKSENLSGPVFYELFLYDEVKDEYTVVHRKPVENLTEVFGYDYDSKVIDSYDEGDTIPNGTVLYKSTSYGDYMEYRYGQNVPIVYTLDPITFEDAAGFSDEFAEEFMSSEVEEIEIGLNDNDYLINMFGKDIEHYRSLPKLGEYVDGVLAVSRRLFNNQVLYDFRDSQLSKIIEGDSVYYYTGTVIDYSIYVNNPDLPDNPFNRDIIKYMKEERRYWKKIYDTCKYIKKSGSKYSNDIEYLLKRSMQELDTENSKWKEGDSEFSNVVIRVLVAKHVGCTPGQKCTPRYGNKSVASKIIPKEEMPYYYDENGNKVHAKVMLNLLAIINRTTAYPLYELAITFIEDKLARYMRTLKTRKEREDIFFDVLSTLDHKFAKDTLDIYNKGDDAQKEEDLNFIMYGDENYSNGILFRDIPFYEERPIFYRIMDIYQKYKDTWLKPDRVYVNRFGREIPILNKYRISEMYVMKLKQTSRKGYSARSMGAINSKNLPERSYKSRAHLEITSSTPIRFGEYETLNFSIAQETDVHALFHALYRTSPKGREDLAKIIMDPTKDEGDIADIYISRTAEIFNVIFMALGCAIEFSNTDNTIMDLDDHKICAYKINNTGYLCTELTAFMLERIHEIVSNHMKNSPFMDTNELIDFVRDELLSSKYIMGVGRNDPERLEKILNLYFDRPTFKKPQEPVDTKVKEITEEEPKVVEEEVKVKRTRKSKKKEEDIKK